MNITKNKSAKESSQFARASNASAAEEDRSPTIAQRIRQGLEEDILFSRLRPGARIDEVSVGLRYGVSRTPVREALNSLASTGLVDIRPRQGAFVAELTIPKLIEMFEVMAALEGFCVRLAARRATPSEIEDMWSCHAEVNEFAKAGDTAGFIEKNNHLHDLFYNASGNETLIEMTQSIRRKVAPYRRFATYQQHRMLDSIGEHEAVIKAIVDRNEEQADSLMRQHLSLLALGFNDVVAAIKKNSQFELP